MHQAPFKMGIPTDAPGPAMLTRALNVFVDLYGEQMICTTEERKMHGAFSVQTSYLVIDGPCKGRRFKIAVTLEPDETVTH